MSRYDTSSRVYFGRLPQDCRERDLEKFLEGYGRIREIHLRNGYGFVEFKDIRDAEDVVEELNGRTFLGDRIVVEFAKAAGRGVRERPPPPTRTGNRVIVENVAPSVSWQDLKDFFKRAGEIAFADCHKRRQGEGLVEFFEHDDMKYAIEKYDDADFKGNRLRVFEDTGNSNHSRSRRDRSRSHSPRRRSRSPRRDHNRNRSRSPKHDDRKRRYSRSRSPKIENDRTPPRSSSVTKNEDGDYYDDK